jgi:hypothetical protein
MMHMRSQGESVTTVTRNTPLSYKTALLTRVCPSVDGWKYRESMVSHGAEGRGVRVRMIRISRLVEFCTPNPVSSRGGVTMWQMRRISNCARSFVSIRRWSCARTSSQSSVKMDGMDSGVTCGQRSWDVLNNAIRARAGPFMCRMRADEENTIMPETSFCGEVAWLCENDCGMRLLSGGTFSPSVQELHPNDRCRKRDYPVHIDSNVVAKASLRTKTVSWWRKLN